MFRIDRNNVKLSAARSARIDKESKEAGAAGDIYPDAAASASEAAAEEADAIAMEIISEAREKAEKIVEEAKDEIAILMVDARDEAEEERRRAWQEGYAEGAKEGKRSFDKELADKMSEDDEKLKSIIQDLYEERTNTYSNLEQEAVKLSLEVVRKIINPSEEEFGSVFESLIKNALRQINLDGKIMIRVAPSEHERFFPMGSSTFDLDNGVTVTASVLRDPSLSSGDCIIDTEGTTTNAGLESQLRYIELAFDKADVYEQH